MDDHNNVYIVLSRSNTILSHVIHLLKGDKYTHAALSLDRDLKHMFSFGRRWAYNPFVGCFKRENLSAGIYKSHDCLPGTIIQIPVSPAQYKSVTRQIDNFLLYRVEYGYNYLGLFVNLFGNPFGQPPEDNERFFCSEFVYYVLNGNGVCDLGLHRGLVRPQDLMKLSGKIIFEGDLMKYRRNLARAYLN
jgi:hypothetical protein